MIEPRATVLSLAWLTAPNEPSALERQSAEQQEQSAREGEISADTAKRLPPVSEGPGEAETDQQESTADAENANERPLTTTEADLLAQERVAHWTLWIGVFTALGLWALIWTLLETREMMRADARAYVEILWIDMWTNGTYGATLALHISNFGRTPATALKFDDFAELSHRHQPMWIGNRDRPGKPEHASK